MSYLLNWQPGTFVRSLSLEKRIEIEGITAGQWGIVTDPQFKYGNPYRYALTWLPNGWPYVHRAKLKDAKALAEVLEFIFGDAFQGLPRLTLTSPQPFDRDPYETLGETAANLWWHLKSRYPCGCELCHAATPVPFAEVYPPGVRTDERGTWWATLGGVPVMPCDGDGEGEQEARELAEVLCAVPGMALSFVETTVAGGGPWNKKAGKEVS